MGKRFSVFTRRHNPFQIWASVIVVSASVCEIYGNRESSLPTSSGFEGFFATIMDLVEDKAEEDLKTLSVNIPVLLEYAKALDNASKGTTSRKDISRRS